MSGSVIDKMKPKRHLSAYETPTEEKIAMGQRLIDARELAGLTQAEAADAMGYVQAVQLSYMESGQRMPNLSQVIAFASLYGTTVDFLCGLVIDSDRDPALAVQLYVTARVTADIQDLTRRVSNLSVEVIRSVVPTPADGMRVVELAGRVNKALARVRELNPQADEDMRGLSALVNNVELLRAEAAMYASKVDRSKRVLAIRSAHEAKAGDGVARPSVDLYATCFEGQAA